MSWTGGYVSEIDYTHGYYRELSPVFARVALANKAVTTVDLGRPRYLELGIGQGLSFALHAAACPGDYWGTDFNPAQAAEAAELVAASGTDARVFDQSFAELAERDDLPEFDVIALHGIWTWVSDENRRTIVELVRRRLRPGGLVYVSYNVTPGWSPSMPLRELMTLHAERAGTDAAGIVSRIDGAIEFVQKLVDTGALYFKKNPAVIERFEKIKTQNKKYLAHEYFNADWHPMPFQEVARQLEPAKLGFACSAHLLEHLDGIHLSTEAQALLSGIGDVVLREAARDYFTNLPFRRDYFVRGPRRMPPSVQAEALRKLRFVLARPVRLVEFKVKGALGVAQLLENVYRPVLEALEADSMRPKSLAELEAATAGKGVPFSQLQQACMLLAGKGDIYPAQDEEAAAEVRERTRALNRHLMKRALATGEIQHVASPVTGAGITASRIELFFMTALGEGKEDPEDWARLAWQVLSSQNQRVLKDGKPIEAPDDNVAELMRQSQEWRDVKLPVLRATGVVD